MENTFHDHPGFMNFDDENQVLIFIRNLWVKFFNSSASYFLTAMHYIFLPVVLMYSFWAHALEQSWQITKYVSNEVFELMKIIPLTFELWFWSALIFIEVIFFFKNVEETAVEVEKQVYGKMKEILRKLRAFPLSAQNAAALYSFMKKIPIFGKGRLPFPNFLFEETFTKVQFRRGFVSMTVTSPTDSSQAETEPQTGTETPAPTSDQPHSSVIPPPPPPVESELKPVTTATKRKSATKSEEKPTTPVDSSTPQSQGTSESEVKTSKSS